MLKITKKKNDAETHPELISGPSAPGSPGAEDAAAMVLAFLRSFPLTLESAQSAQCKAENNPLLNFRMHAKSVPHSMRIN